MSSNHLELWGRTSLLNEGSALELNSTRYRFWATFLSGTTYGIYATLTYASLQILWSHRSTRKASLCYSIIMLCITTAYTVFTAAALEVVRPIEVKNNPSGADYCSLVGLVTRALGSVIVAGSDIILLYRAFALCNRRWIVILLPSLIWLVFCTCAITMSGNCMPVTSVAHGSAVIVYWTLAAPTSALCALLIVVSIVRAQHRAWGSSICDYRYWIGVITESGALYAVIGMVNLVLVAQESKSSTLSSAALISLAYLTQAYIVLRTALGTELKASCREHPEFENKLSNVQFTSIFVSDERPGWWDT